MKFLPTFIWGDPLENLEFAYYTHLSRKDEIKRNLKQIQAAQEIYQRQQGVIKHATETMNNHIDKALSLDDRTLAASMREVQRKANSQFFFNQKDLQGLILAEQTMERSLALLTLRVSLLKMCMEIIKGQQEVSSVNLQVYDSVNQPSKMYQEAHHELKKELKRLKEMLGKASSDKSRQLLLMIQLFSFTEELEEFWKQTS